MKFVCSSHPEVELEMNTINRNDRIGISPCPTCYKNARRYGKQFVLNMVAQGFAQMVKEEREEDEQEEEEE